MVNGVVRGGGGGGGSTVCVAPKGLSKVFTRKLWLESLHTSYLHVAHFHLGLSTNLASSITCMVWNSVPYEGSGRK